MTANNKTSGGFIMVSSAHVRERFLASSLALLVVLLAFPLSAQAEGTATFSAPLPAPATTVAPPTAASVHVVADSAITGATFTFGSATRAGTVSYPIGHWEVVGFDDWE